MAKLSDVYGVTKPPKRPKTEVKIKSAPPVYARPDEFAPKPHGVLAVAPDGSVTIKFVLEINRILADGLEKERAKRGLRSRSETIRVLLAEALK